MRKKPKEPTPTVRLAMIAAILENRDRTLLAEDGPVTQDPPEFRQIYLLAKDCIADAFTPEITKLVEALRQINLEIRDGQNALSLLAMEMVRAALAELGEDADG